MRGTQRDDLCRRHYDSEASQNRWDLLLGLGKSNNKYAEQHTYQIFQGQE